MFVNQTFFALVICLHPSMLSSHCVHLSMLSSHCELSEHYTRYRDGQLCQQLVSNLVFCKVVEGTMGVVMHNQLRIGWLSVFLCRLTSEGVTGVLVISIFILVPIILKMFLATSITMPH